MIKAHSPASKEKFTAPSPHELKALYRTADRIKELAAWQWMNESELFGVRNPETGEIGFVSVMGMAGEHFAVSVYLGAEGLEGFENLTAQLLPDDPMSLLNIPQLQVSFENRDLLNQQDREEIKSLGLKYRGQKAWPMFRSYRAGFMPWHVTSDEARFLTCALEQLLEVAPRVRENSDVLHGNQDEYLVREPREPEGKLYWEDRLMTIPAAKPLSFQVRVVPETLDEAAKLPLIEFEIEMDFFPSPAPVAEKGQRPYFPYTLLVADSKSGAILGVEMIPPLPTLQHAWELLPQSLIDSCLSNGSIPRKITVREEIHYQLLLPLTKAMRFQLQRSDDLPALDPAIDGMMNMMGGFF
jgi:hypothetical protein